LVEVVDDILLALMPTGLILQIKVDPFQDLGHVQLSIRRESFIRDACFCLSASKKKQCFWIIDDENFVWRSQSEVGSSSGKWSLSQVHTLPAKTGAKIYSGGTDFNRFFDSSGFG